MIGKYFSNGWKNWREFSNDWKNLSRVFQPLELRQLGQPKPGGRWETDGKAGKHWGRGRPARGAPETRKTRKKANVFCNLASSCAPGSRTSEIPVLLLQKLPRHFRGCGILPRLGENARPTGRTASCHLSLFTCHWKNLSRKVRPVRQVCGRGHGCQGDGRDETHGNRFALFPGGGDVLQSKHRKTSKGPLIEFEPTITI